MLFSKDNFGVTGVGNAPIVQATDTIMGSADTVDSNVKRVMLLERWHIVDTEASLKILASAIIREDGQWELHAPYRENGTLMLLATDEGGNFNADVFDRVSLQSSSYQWPQVDLDTMEGYRKAALHMHAYTELVKTNLVEHAIVKQSVEGVEKNFGSSAEVLAVKDAGLQTAILEFNDDSIKRLKGVGLSSLDLSTSLYDFTDTKVESVEILGVDSAAITETITNVLLPIRVEDFPAIADNFDIDNDEMWVTTLYGDVCKCELNGWDSVSKTGILWVNIPTLYHDKTNVLLLSLISPFAKASFTWGPDASYSADNTGTVYKYSKDNVYVWTSESNYGLLSACEIGWEEDLYVYNYNTGLNRINKDTGEEVWRVPSGALGHMYYFVFIGKYLFGTTSTNHIIKVDVELGTIIWDENKGTPTSVKHSVITKEGKLYVPQTKGFAVFDLLDTCAFVEHIDLTGVVGKSVTPTEVWNDRYGNFYISYTRRFYKLNPTLDTLLWERSFNIFVPTYSPNDWIVDLEGNIYFVQATTHDVGKLNSDGVIQWQNTDPTATLNTIALDNDGNVYAGSDSDYVYKINGETGVLIWSRDIGGNVEVLAKQASTLTDHARYFKVSYYDKLPSIWGSTYDVVFHCDNTPVGTDAVKDATGNGNHATPSNMAANNLVDSYLGKGLQFDGVEEFLTLSGLYTSVQATGQVDIVFKTSANVGTLLSQDKTGWNDLDSIIGIGQNGAEPVTNGHVAMETHGPNVSESRGVESTDTINDGEGHIISVVWTGTNYRLCVDGVFESDVTSSYGFWGADGIVDILIAASGDTGSSFAGELSEIRIHNTPKTTSETITFHKAVLGTLYKTQEELHEFDIGANVALSFDNEDSFKIWDDSVWRVIATKNATHHGGSDDGNWYFQKDSGTGDIVYEASGSWVSKPMLLDVRQDVLSSLVDWAQNLPANTSLYVYSKLEVSATEPVTPPGTWDSVTKDAAIPNLGTGSTTNTWLWIKVTLSTTDTGETSSIDDLDFQISYDVVTPKAEEDLDTAAEWNDNYSISNLTVTGDTLVLGAGGDTGTRIGTPLDLSTVFNLQSIAIDWNIDEDTGLQLIPDFTDGWSGVATGMPFCSYPRQSTTYALWKAFDGLTSTYFTVSGVYSTGVPLYIGFSFKTAQIVTSYMLRTYSINLTKFDLMAWDEDEKIWVLLDAVSETINTYPANTDHYFDNFSEGKNKTAYKTYVLKCRWWETSQTYFYLSKLQFYTDAMQLSMAIVESTTEPITPPAAEAFSRVYKGETSILGLSVNDDLRNKWVWIKQVIECDFDKPVLTDCVITLNGNTSLSLKKDTYQKWEDYTSITDLSGANDLRLTPATGVWQSVKGSDNCNVIAEAMQENVANRMTFAELKAVLATDFDDTGGYLNTTGDLKLGIGLFNVSTFADYQLGSLNINSKKYRITPEYNLPNGDVVTSQIYWGFLKSSGSYDYSTIKVFSSLDGADWQECLTSGGEITSTPVDTEMDGKTIQFKLEAPRDFPEESKVILHMFIE